MKKQEKDLLISIAQDLIDLWDAKNLSRESLLTVKEGFKELPFETNDWDKIMQDNFESFLKHVHDAHKGTKVERSDDNPCPEPHACNTCDAGQKNEFKYLYTIHLHDGDRIDVEGNSSDWMDNRFFIYFGTVDEEVKACFTDFVGYTITPLKEEEC